jgi:hypothetical protein
LSLTLKIQRTIFLLDKHIGNSRAGLNEEQNKSRSHTCISHKENFHHKLEIAAYGLASVAKPMVQYVRIIQVKVSKMDKGNHKK